MVGDLGRWSSREMPSILFRPRKPTWSAPNLFWARWASCRPAASGTSRHPVGDRVDEDRVRAVELLRQALVLLEGHVHAGALGGDAELLYPERERARARLREVGLDRLAGLAAVSPVRLTLRSLQVKIAFSWAMVRLLGGVGRRTAWPAPVSLGGPGHGVGGERDVAHAALAGPARSTTGRLRTGEVEAVSRSCRPWCSGSSAFRPGRSRSAGSGLALSPSWARCVNGGRSRARQGGVQAVNVRVSGARAARSSCRSRRSAR